jgi:hypothetical protein
MKLTQYLQVKYLPLLATGIRHAFGQSSNPALSFPVVIDGQIFGPGYHSSI